MPGFAEEVAASKTGKPATAEHAPKEGDETQLPVGNMGEAEFNTGLEASEESEVEPGTEKPAAKPAESAAPEEKKAKIRIGNRTFESADEALAYAQELEIARAQDQGFIEGVKTATKKDETAAPVKTKYDELEEQFFENPKEAFKKLHDMVKDEVKSEWTSEQAQAAARNSTWETFYQENADLAEYQDLISGEGHLGGPLLQKYWNEVAKLPTKQGLETLANKVRSALKISAKPAAETEELEVKEANVVTPAGKSTGKVTPGAEKNSDEGLDFITQVRKHGKRSAS